MRDGSLLERDLRSDRVPVSNGSDAPPTMLPTLIAGAALALAPAPLQTPDVVHHAAGPQTGARAGNAICPAGDWNGDGVDDYAVGIAGHTATQFVLGPYPDQGLVQIRSGVDGALIREFEDALQTDTNGVVIPLELGTALAGPFDSNHNGLPEVAASLPGADQVVLIERGPTFFQPITVVARIDATQLIGGDGVTVLLEFDEERLGETLANVGDVDGDGHDDLAIGSPSSNVVAYYTLGASFFPLTGCARIVSGSDLSIISSHGVEEANARFGSAICAVPDMSGDGRNEVAFGIPGEQRVLVTAPAPSTPAAEFESSIWQTSDEFGGFGSALACVGDVNGGGLPDLLVGSPSSVNTGGPLPLQQGRVSLHALESAGQPFAVTLLWERTRVNSDLGRAIEVVDLDGDGAPEALCVEDSAFASNPTAVVALDPVTGQFLASFDAPHAGADAGLANVGDLDGDGGEEFVVGLPDIDFERGAAIVHGYELGTPSGGAPTVWTVDDDGPADFDSLALAALVVDAGDVLRVLPGEYDSTSILRALTVLGEPAAGDLVEVTDVEVDTSAGATVTGLALDGLRIEGCGQRTTIGDCVVEGPTVRITDCDDLALVGCTITAFTSTALGFTGPAGVHVLGSDVRFNGCTIHGGESPVAGTDGGAALIVDAGSRVWMASTDLFGANGSDGIDPLAIEGGNGGEGLRAIADALVDVRGNGATTIRGGDEGAVDLGGNVEGRGVTADAGTDVWVSSDVDVVDWSGPVTFGAQRPWLDRDATADLGSAVVARTFAEAGSVAVVMLSVAALNQDEALVLEAPLLIDPFAFIDFAVVLGNGPTTPAVRTWPVPNAPQLIGATVEIQAFQYDLSTDAFYGTNGGRITLVP